MIYQKDLEIAEREKASNQKFFQKLKKKNPKEVDKQFHQQHEQVFAKVDCLKCANCCKTTSPIFRDVDIQRISKKLKMKVADFIASYLRLDEESDYVLQTSPCHFLQDDNTCSIYEFRPLACSEYPHTDRKNMHQILTLTDRNTLVCPAVSRIVENLKLKNS